MAHSSWSCRPSCMASSSAPPYRLTEPGPLDRHCFRVRPDPVTMCLKPERHHSLLTAPAARLERARRRALFQYMPSPSGSQQGRLDNVISTIRLQPGSAVASSNRLDQPPHPRRSSRSVETSRRCLEQVDRFRWHRIRKRCDLRKGADLGFWVGAGEGNRTLMTSLEGCD